MNLAQVLLVFAGIPALVTFLVSAAIFGGDWVAWARRHRTRQRDG